MIAAAPARSMLFADAIGILKKEGSNGPQRERASTVLLETAKASVEHVALRWFQRGTLRRWMDLDDLCQELRVVLLTRCVKGFRIPEGKDDREVARIFGRYAIVVLHNYLRDAARHAGRNWTMHLKSIDSAGEGRSGAVTTGKSGWNAAEIVPDERNYVNEAGGLDEREMWGAVRGALSEEQAKIAYLLYEGKTWKEVGAILGQNPMTLRDRLRLRATPVLRALLSRWAS